LEEAFFGFELMVSPDIAEKVSSTTNATLYKIEFLVTKLFLNKVAHLHKLI